MKAIKMADPRASPVADLAPGQSADDIEDGKSRLTLNADEFTSTLGFRKHDRLLVQAAGECGMKFDSSTAAGSRPALRVVVFREIEDFRLDNYAYILRCRVRFEDGFPAEQQAAEVDVSPNIPGDYRIQFRAEGAPRKHRLGGYRLLSEVSPFPVPQSADAAKKPRAA